MNPSVRYLLSLVRAALLDIDPPPPEGVDFDQIRRLSAFLHLDIPCYYSMRRAGIASTEDEDGAFIGNVVKDAEQKDAEQKLVLALGEAGIDVMPLKGCLLKPLYPASEMRYMGDIDLYYRGNDETLLSVMKKLGCSVKIWKGHRIHHVFGMEPFIDIEMHYCLTVPENPLADVLSDSVWERASEDPDRPGVYRMSYEDEYLFLLLHALKHFYASGFGIRNYYDFWLFRRAHPEVPESPRVREILSRAGLLTFAERICHLSDVLMSEEAFSPEDEEMISFSFKDGTYGSQIGSISRKMTKTPSRSRYFLRRIFPPIMDLAERYPTLAKGGAIRLLYPWYWLRRFCSIMMHSRHRVKQDLMTAATVDDGAFDVFRLQRAYLGLSEDLSVVDDDDDSEVTVSDAT